MLADLLAAVISWRVDGSVFCGTWNVNCKRPTEDLRLWLGDEIDFQPDIYVLGCVPGTRTTLGGCVAILCAWWGS